MLTRFRNIAYVLAYAVATIPLWHYIRDGRILALMVAVVTFAYINVVLSTVQAAQPILSSEKAKTPLPRWLPDKPKYQKWWLLIRGTLKWYLLLIPPKMGLALGFVQYYFLSDNLSWVQYHWLQSNYDYGVSSGATPLYPELVTIMIALFAVIIFTIVEAGFISSITLLTKSVQPPRKNLLCVVSLRCLFTLTMVALTTFSRDMLNPRVLFLPTRPFDVLICSFIGYDLINIHYADRDIATEKCRLKVLETTNTALLTSLEQSVLLSANIMRPHYEGWDNRLFVARQIVAAVLGMLLYAGATWIVLWFIEDEKS
jgi:hypothetical protein